MHKGMVVCRERKRKREEGGGGGERRRNGFICHLIRILQTHIARGIRVIRISPDYKQTRSPIGEFAHGILWRRANQTVCSCLHGFNLQVEHFSNDSREVTSLSQNALGSTYRL